MGKSSKRDVKKKGGSSRPAQGSAPSHDEEDLRNPGLFAEFFGFIRDNKKWWLIPLIVMLLLIGGLLLLAGQHTALAPFIYTLF